MTSNHFCAGEIDQKSSRAFVDGNEVRLFNDGGKRFLAGVAAISAVGMISHFWNS